MAYSRALPPLKALAFSCAEWVEVKTLIRYVVPPTPVLGTNSVVNTHRVFTVLSYFPTWR